MHLALKLAPADPAILYRSALVLELSGQRRRGLDALSAALAAGYSLNVVEREPELNALRQDPHYRDASLHAREKK
jgi:hypothetical protein